MDWRRASTLAALAGALSGCAGTGTWNLETWGEDYIEQGIPAEDFADGCSVHYDRFLFVATRRAVLDGDGEVAGEVEGAQVYSLVPEGPHPMGSAELPATHYDTVLVEVAPDPGATAGNAGDDELQAVLDAGASVLVAGTIDCGGNTVTFDWAFDTATAYYCEPDSLVVPAGGEDTTQFTVHGDHLFYDGLENPDAVLRARAIVDADADSDGAVTLEELEQVPVAGLGYQVGRYAEVETLADFVAFLSRTIGHIDGEGHCQVDL